MPVRVLFSNESVAVDVLVNANLTDSPMVSQSGYADENGTISLFARTTNNQIAVTGIVLSLSGVTLVLMPFGSNATNNSTVISRQTSTNVNEKSSREYFLRHLTKRDVTLPGFTVHTFGEQLQLVSKIFMTEENPTSVYVRYKFATEEVPGGFFGSRFNDYFTINIRSEKGSYESLSQSMNGLGLGAFNYASGATDWHILKLKVSSEPELIQVDVDVSNVVDALY